ncbi:hypothetical protein GQ53DRAFT_789956 [Thozetella sp. PMI_491]|nr:hypothetical protein GQ53DRAFT_789956 [Thozetella sp. PMI_491]
MADTGCRTTSSSTIETAGTLGSIGLASHRNDEQNDALIEVSEDSFRSEVQFDSVQCLFCQCSSSSFDENLEHMSKAHGLFIPDKTHLIVDTHTLVEYFHLVIYGYFECLYCGSQRASAQGAQQHMLGKGHCKIDISREGSEYKDFYDFGSTSEDSDSDAEDVESDRGRLMTSFVDTDQSMRLPSGKILLHRSQAKPRPRRHILPSPEAPTRASQGPAGLAFPEPDQTSPSTASSDSKSKRLVKREAVFSNQLASLRADDRRSLMHLPLATQRAIVAKGRKQVEQARQDENKMRLKIQLKANP